MIGLTIYNDHIILIIFSFNALNNIFFDLSGEVHGNEINFEFIF